MKTHSQTRADRDRIARLWTPRAQPWFPDGPDSSALALLKFVPDAAHYWDAPKGRMLRAFGAMASMITGQPDSTGEQGTHSGLSTPETAAAA
jgi:Pyridoxamine 5'-phosphate oxidase like